MITTILLGGITHHYLASNLNYCNTINDVGTIYNQYTIVMVGNENAKLGFLKGRDSACGDIFGPISSFKVSDNVDFVLGGYNTNIQAFEERGILPPTIGGITPVVGFNFKIPLIKTRSYEVNLNNLISFGIATHAISVDF